MTRPSQFPSLAVLQKFIIIIISKRSCKCLWLRFKARENLTNHANQRSFLKGSQSELNDIKSITEGSGFQLIESFEHCSVVGPHQIFAI